MNDRKLAIVTGLLRGIMELCVTALTILEPDEVEEPEPQAEEGAEHPLRKRLGYLGEDDEPEKMGA